MTPINGGPESMRDATMSIAKIGSSFVLNTVTEETQSYVNLATLSDGRFVAVWLDESSILTKSYEPFINPFVKAQIFSADGAKIGSEITVGSTPEDHFYATPSIAALSDGGFAISADLVTGYSEHKYGGVILSAEGSQVGDFSLSPSLGPFYAGDGLARLSHTR